MNENEKFPLFVAVAALFISLISLATTLAIDENNFSIISSL
jgi:hypothetical protein